MFVIHTRMAGEGLNGNNELVRSTVRASGLAKLATLTNPSVGVSTLMTRVRSL